MKLLPFALGVGVGYVLGARAGRERYEQLSRAYRRVADNPQVQAAAGVAQAKAGEAVHAAVNVAKEKVAPSSGPGQPQGHQPAAPGRSAGPGR
ncbi:hypothetical protein [Actinomycetospora sp. NBRC 106378]|uniref:hypothetical protein n=1 Tax=Actinomycetospora sp. NBRC 106378 TaxID=3032208 RepID=UPI0024A1B86F|nr:hypothetical protein [Actinomycetospora sp. NBRC 106378]GLZ51472.1 hypothetical protein Acsp07_10890 [Actinomycetospora sp. NBRC 106378]